MALIFLMGISYGHQWIQGPQPNILLRSLTGRYGEVSEYAGAADISILAQTIRLQGDALGYRTLISEHPKDKRSFSILLPTVQEQ